MQLSGVDVALTDSGTAFTVETSTDVNGCKCAIPFSNIYIDTRQQHAHVVYKFDRRAFPVMQPSSSYTMFVAIDQVALAGLQPTFEHCHVAVDSEGDNDRHISHKLQLRRLRLAPPHTRLISDLFNNFRWAI
jgi:hypothetical protein